MSAKTSDYRLVLFETPDDPPAVRDLLCRVTGIHPTDAMLWVAKTPGIWPRPLTAGEARDLLDGLYNLQVPAEAHRSDIVLSLNPPRNLHAAACLPEGLRVKGLRGEPTHWVPWERVELVAAGRVAVEDEFREVRPPGWVSAFSTGINALLRRPQDLARRKRGIRVERGPVREIILVRRDPRIAFRIVENQMDYSYLGERLSTTAAENFPKLLADICLLASVAYVTDSTLSLLGREPREDADFATSQGLLDYAAHRLLWSWYRRDRDHALETQT